MRVMYLTQTIYPLSGGRVLASYGNASVLSKYCELTVVSLVRGDSVLFAATEQFCKDNNINGVFEYTTPKKEYRKIFLELPSRIIANITMTVPLYKDFFKLIENIIKEQHIDIIIVDHIGMAQYLKNLCKHFPSKKFIYNSQNAEFLNTSQELKQKAGTNVLKQIMATIRCSNRKAFEKKMIASSDFVFSISKSDIDILSKEFGYSDKYIYLKPLIQFNRIKSLEDIKKYNHRLLIVGSMNWYPNTRGVLWFVDKVFKELKAKDPLLKLLIVGNNPIKEIKELASEDIIVTGFVESTKPYFRECDISVIPVFEGTGAKIKVLESIAAGIPTVCSSFAAKDYDGEHGMAVVDKAEEFIEAITLFSEDLDYRLKAFSYMNKYYQTYFELNPQIVDIIGGSNL